MASLSESHGVTHAKTLSRKVSNLKILVFFAPSRLCVKHKHL